MLDIIYFFSEGLEKNPNFKITVCDKGFWIQHALSTDFLPFDEKNGKSSWSRVCKLNLPTKKVSFPLFHLDTLWFSMTIPFSFIKNSIYELNYPQKYVYVKFNIPSLIDRFLCIKRLFINDLHSFVLFLLLKILVYHYSIDDVITPFIYWQGTQELEKDILRSLPKGFISNSFFFIKNEV